MTPETLISALYVFALAAFLGYQVISRVPPLLHTPLMSATNAISGISLVGSIVTAGARLQHRKHHSRIHRRFLFDYQRGRRFCDYRSHAANV